MADKKKNQGQSVFSSGILETSNSNRLWVETNRKVERIKFDRYGRHAMWMNYKGNVGEIFR